MSTESDCRVPGCHAPVHARGHCHAHYRRERRAGRLLSVTDAARFWAKVERRGPDECWPWMAAVAANGYGHFSLRGRITTASRALWEMETGPIPSGLDVCHTCDNRRCVNPAHLFLGTRLVNVRDCIAKGRHARGGAGCKHAKLSVVDVQKIRRLVASGHSQSSVARAYGVALGTVQPLIRRETWRHVA